MPDNQIPTRPISPWRQPLPSDQPAYRRVPRSEPGAPPRSAPPRMPFPIPKINDPRPPSDRSS